MSVVHIYEPARKPIVTQAHARRLNSRRRTWKREDAMSGRTRKRVSYMRRKAAEELGFVVVAALMVVGYLLLQFV